MFAAAGLSPGTRCTPAALQADPCALPSISAAPPHSQVVFFSQGALPALTEGGQIIMEGPSRLAMAPDGNGGVYMAMRAEGVLLCLVLLGGRGTCSVACSRSVHQVLQEHVCVYSAGLCSADTSVLVAHRTLPAPHPLRRAG